MGLTRNLGPLSVRASVSPATLDDERRTVEVVWTTGERVLRGTYDPYWEELSLEPDHVDMARLHGGAPLLNTHSSNDLGDVIGVVESARLEKTRGIATVRFARAEDDPEADAIFRKVKDGVIRHVSVGYRVLKMEKVEDGDDKVPVYRATRWTPYEISMVPMGADAGAGVRNSSAADTNPCELVEPQERSMAKMKNAPQTRTSAPTPTAPAGGSEGADDPAESEGGGADEPAEGDAETPAPTPPASDDAARSAVVLEARAAERARISSIQRIGRTLGLPVEFAQRHVDAGTTVTAFRAKAQDEFAARGQIDVGAGPSIVGGEDARDKWLRGAGAWLLSRTGAADVVAAAAKRRGEKIDLDPGEFRGMTLMELAKDSLDRARVSTRGLDKMAVAGKAFTHRAGGYHTTSDFAVLLEGTTSRVLLAAYATAPDAWRKIAAIGSVSDFRPNKRLRQGTFGRLDKVNEHGEFKNKPIADGAAESISAKTYGNIVGVTRQMVVNDDLGFLVGLSQRLGRAAALSIELMVFDLLAENSGLGPTMADGYTLFHANHGNIGTGSALSVAGLDADRVKMATQRDPGLNEYLDIRPKVLLVPIGLEGQARVMLEAEFDVDEGDGTTPNRIRGYYPEIVGSPRIAGTRRYAFADPAEVPTIEVVFLDGQQQPFLDQQDGWRIDGTEWKVRLDAGVGAVDWRGAVTNAGA